MIETFKRNIFITAILLFVLTSVDAQRRIDYLQYARMELSRENYTLAIEHLNIYIRQQPMIYEGFQLRAIAKYELHDYSGAEEDANQAIFLYPFRADLFCLRGVARDKLFDYHGALEDYNKAISLDPSDALTYSNRAITYLSLHRYQLAINDCNTAELLKLKNENLSLVKGAAHFGLHDYKNAIDDYTSALHQNPINKEAYVQRAMAFHASQKRDSSAKDFGRALSLDSTDISILLRRAGVAMEDSLYKDALIDFNRVLKLAPSCASAYFNRAIVKSNLNDIGDAIEDYNRLLILKPNYLLAYYNRASLRWQQEDIKGALNDYNKVIEISPDFVQAYTLRSQVKRMMGDMKGATQDLNKFKKLEQFNYTQNDSLRSLSQMHLMQLFRLEDNNKVTADFKETIQDQGEHIKLQPMFSVVTEEMPYKHIRLYTPPGKHPVMLSNKNDTFNVWNVQKKIEQLSVTISKNPYNANLYLNRALLYSLEQSFNNAFVDYNKTIALDSTNAIAFFNRANTRLKLLQLLLAPEAEKVIEQLKLQPNENGDLKYMTHTYAMVNQDYSRTLALDSNFSYAWYNRATAKFMTNDYLGALSDFSAALKCDTNFAEAYFNKGAMLIVLQENRDASIYLSKAGELGILESYEVMKTYCYR